jgi:membrane-associated phospholipid phosphatase
MNPLNLALFDALAAGFSPSPTVLWFASAIALGSSWACAALLAWAAWRRPPERPGVLAVLAAGGAASLISHEIAASIGVPRPFMVGLSPAHVPHGVRAGLPSTHASVMFTMAFMLLPRRGLRDVGLLVLAIAAITAWSRIYVGVHFPFDIAAGALLGACMAAALFGLRAAGRRLAPESGGVLAWPLRALTGGRAGPSLVLVFIFAAALIGLNTPEPIGPAVLEESGPVEKSTILLYLAAALCLLTVRVAPLSRLDRTALCMVLLAFAAREADWHLAHPDRWLLVSFAPLAAAGLWLAKRTWSARYAMQSWCRWRPEAITLLTFAAVIGTAIVLDQIPVPVADQAAFAERPPDFYRYLVLSFEEVLELALPVLALLAILQARWGSNRSPHGSFSRTASVALPS